MQMHLNGSALIPKLSLKPLLFVALSGVSGTGLYSSLKLGALGESKEAKKILDKVGAPLNEATKQVGTGSGKLYLSLSNWAKEVVNRKDIIYEWIGGNPSVTKVSNGARTIFTNLKKWGEEALKFAKDKLPNLIQDLKKIKSFIKQFFPLFWKALSVASVGGDTPIIKKLFEAAGNEKFDEFATVLNDISDKKSDVLSSLSEEETGDILSAFKNNPEETLKIMQEFADSKENKGKSDLLEALKSYTLVEKINAVTARAKELIAKGSGMTSEEKKEAKDVYGNLQTLRSELQKTIEKAQQELRK